MQHCVSSQRTAILLKMLDFTPNHLQKVLVFTDSVDEVEMVHQVTKQPNLACNITVKKKKKRHLSMCTQRFREADQLFFFQVTQQ